jgi:hypothetical protein
MGSRKDNLEKFLSEELMRFEKINAYVDPLNEQFLGLGKTTFMTEQPDGGHAGEDKEIEDDVMKLDTEAEGEEGTLEGESTEEKTEEKTEEEAPEGEEGLDVEETTEGGTQELDVTELVTMTKETGEKADKLEQNIEKQTGSIDSLLGKLDDLESKLGEMDKIMSSVNQLEKKLEKYKPQTPQEKLELRYLDSGPFNQRPHQYWEEKQGELKKQKDKHEYVLTPEEVDNYNESDIKQSWIYNDEESDTKH